MVNPKKETREKERKGCLFFVENEKSAERKERDQTPLPCSLFFSFPRSISSQSTLTNLIRHLYLSPRSTLVQSLQFSALPPPFVSPCSNLPFSNAPSLSLLLLHYHQSICAHSLPFQPLRSLPSPFLTLMQTLVRLNDTTNSQSELLNNGIK